MEIYRSSTGDKIFVLKHLFVPKPIPVGGIHLCTMSLLTTRIPYPASFSLSPMIVVYPHRSAHEWRETHNVTFEPTNIVPSRNSRSLHLNCHFRFFEARSV